MEQRGHHRFTDRIDQTTLKQRIGLMGEQKNPLGCWATYVNNNYIPNPHDEDIGMTGKIIRVDQFPLVGIFYNANLLKAMPSII